MRLAPAGLALGGVLMWVGGMAAVDRWQGAPGAGADPLSRARIVPAVEQALAWGSPPPAAIPVPQARSAPAEPQRPQDRLYARLRQQVRWMPVQIDGKTFMTPDLPSRLMLVMSAAREARLHEVGLGFEDVYGVITAETSWAPREGSSRDGTPNLGIAQFEPATAEAVGLRDPHDVVEAVHAAAQHMKEAAGWSAARISRLKLDRETRKAKLREGVSIYYNLSSRGRAAWNGLNTHQLPVQTHRHIRNARDGAREAAILHAQLRPGRKDTREPVLTAALDPSAGRPQPLQ